MFLKIMQRMQNDDEIGHRGRTQILENDVFHEFHSLSKPRPCLYRDTRVQICFYPLISVCTCNMYI